MPPARPRTQPAKPSAKPRPPTSGPPARPPTRPEQAPGSGKRLQLALKAGQSVRARDILVKATQKDGALAPEKTAEAWLLIGNTDQLNQQSADARVAYQKCLALPGPFAPEGPARAWRRSTWRENHFDDAERALQDVLKGRPRDDPSRTSTCKSKRFSPGPRPPTSDRGRSRKSCANTAPPSNGCSERDRNNTRTASASGPAACHARPVLLERRPPQEPAARRHSGRRQSLLNEDEKKTYQRQRSEFLRMSAEQYDKVEEHAARPRNGPTAG